MHFKQTPNRSERRWNGQVGREVLVKSHGVCPAQPLTGCEPQETHISGGLAFPISWTGGSSGTVAILRVDVTSQASALALAWRSHASHERLSLMPFRFCSYFWCFTSSDNCLACLVGSTVTPHLFFSYSNRNKQTYHSRSPGWQKENRNGLNR